jgi:hypothetical protein
MKKLVVVLFVAGCTLVETRSHRPGATESSGTVGSGTRSQCQSDRGGFNQWSLGKNHTNRYVFEAKGKCTLESFSWCNWGPRSTLCDEASKKPMSFLQELSRKYKKYWLQRNT